MRDRLAFEGRVQLVATEPRADGGGGVHQSGGGGGGGGGVWWGRCGEETPLWCGTIVLVGYGNAKETHDVLNE